MCSLLYLVHVWCSKLKTEQIIYIKGRTISKFLSWEPFVLLQMDEGNNLAADLFFSHISISLSARLTSPSLILHSHKAAGSLFSPPLTHFAACPPTLSSFLPSYILRERCAGQLSPVVFSFSLKCCLTTKMNRLSDASHSLPTFPKDQCGSSGRDSALPWGRPSGKMI